MIDHGDCNTYENDDELKVDLLKNMGKDSVSWLSRKYWILQQDEECSNLAENCLILYLFNVNFLNFDDYHFEDHLVFLIKWFGVVEQGSNDGFQHCLLHAGAKAKKSIKYIHGDDYDDDCWR